ncbi:hypothetical protein [Rubellimicrobium mesophilum]|uniref:hypothetical protein n=1 Tax=Rubellimicrobium mesophilum TaxID=1123067 RepID=UPI0014702CDF|nr:hypothetical protein [Rubellimicrobium mesophilum]
MLAVSALSLFAVCGPLSAEELGPAFAGFSVQMSAGFETPGGQLFEIGTITGALDFENDAAVLEHAAVHCVQEFQENGTGHCAFVTLADSGSESAAAAADEQGAETASDEQSVVGEGLNHLWTSYACKAAAPADVPDGAPDTTECTFTVIEGNGIFEGATGTATAIAVPFFVGHPDGSQSGYANFTSFDLTLKP